MVLNGVRMAHPIHSKGVGVLIYRTARIKVSMFASELNRWISNKSPTSFSALMQDMKKCRTFLMDCDGVLWRGGEIINKADEAVKRLRSSGFRVAFVTNNSRCTHADFVKKLKNYGFEPQNEECFCTAYLTAKYLESRNFSKSIYVVGEPGLAEELETTGFKTYITDHNDINKLVKHDDVGAVVVGLDSGFNYTKIAQAMMYLRDPSVEFLATNTDAGLPLSGGRILPGAGSIIASVKAASTRKPTILGKPSNTMFHLVQKILNLDPDSTCMIGDRIETDILFGRNSGLKTILVLSGVTTSDDYNRMLQAYKQNNGQDNKNFCEPDVVCHDLNEFVNNLLS